MDVLAENYFFMFDFVDHNKIWAQNKRSFFEIYQGHLIHLFANLSISLIIGWWEGCRLSENWKRIPVWLFALYMSAKERINLKIPRY